MRACGCVVQSLTSIVTARNNANKGASEMHIAMYNAIALSPPATWRADSGAGSNRIACPLKVR